MNSPEHRNGELVRCEGVGMRYGSGEAAVVALDRVDLSIRVGDRIVLWGPSGSGKTTLVQLLAGYIAPTNGRLYWIRTARASVVFQGANLLPTFTAFENVSFAAHVAADDPPANVAPEELLQMVGLGSKLDALPSELSGGEQQRVAVARALAQEPVLLLCDEPTGHLDSDTGLRILDLIDALQERLGFGLVTATHDGDVAARFDRSMELADGCIIGVAPELQRR